jgi:hypothetical protein
MARAQSGQKERDVAMSSLPLECQERKGGQDRWHRTSARQREQMQVVSCSRSWVRLGLPQTPFRRLHAPQWWEIRADQGLSVGRPAPRCALRR